MKRRPKQVHDSEHVFVCQLPYRTAAAPTMCRLSYRIERRSSHAGKRLRHRGIIDVAFTDTTDTGSPHKICPDQPILIVGPEIHLGKAIRGHLVGHSVDWTEVDLSTSLKCELLCT